MTRQQKTRTPGSASSSEYTPAVQSEVDAQGVRVGEVVGSGAIGVGGRLEKAGKEISVTVGRAFTVLQRVGVLIKKRQPALDASAVLTCLGDVLELTKDRLGLLV